MVRLVIAEGMRPALTGVLLGAFGAFALGGVLSKLIYGVSAADPLTFVAVALLLALVALAACAIPAYRAARVQPVAALRHEWGGACTCRAEWPVVRRPNGWYWITQEADLRFYTLRFLQWRTIQPSICVLVGHAPFPVPRRKGNISVNIGEQVVARQTGVPP